MIEIEDITETTETADVLLWWQWLLIAILVFALSCALYKWIRHSRNRQPKINNLKTALEQLAMIEAKSSELEDTELATELSLLTRQFLRSQLNNNSLFQTHQEFVNDHQDLELLTEQSRSNVSQYLPARIKIKPH